MESITITLTPTEVQNIVNMMGELPTKTGAWPLMMKIMQQAQAAMNATAAEPEVAKAG